MNLGAGEHVRLLGEDYITWTQWYRKVGSLEALQDTDTQIWDGHSAYILATGLACCIASSKTNGVFYHRKLSASSSQAR